MSIKVRLKDIVKLMERKYPLSNSESWDNSGIQVGNIDKIVNKVLLAVDATDEVIDEAIKGKFDLILTHHPLIFRGIKKVTDESVLGNKLLKLVRNDVAVYSAHTNVDSSLNGTSLALAKILPGFDSTKKLNPLYDEGDKKHGILVNIDTIKLGNLAEVLKEKTGLKSISIVGNENKIVKTVGICTGTGMGYIEHAIKNEVDVFITGDIKYHEAVDAKELGMSLIDLTHYASEVLVLDTLSDLLIVHFGEIVSMHTSKVDGQPFKII